MKRYIFLALTQNFLGLQEKFKDIFPESAGYQTSVFNLPTKDTIFVLEAGDDLPIWDKREEFEAILTGQSDFLGSVSATLWHVGVVTFRVGLFSGASAKKLIASANRFSSLSRHTRIKNRLTLFFGDLHAEQITADIEALNTLAQKEGLAFITSHVC